MILSKSNHPVNIKIIHVRVWNLRSEIEAAIKAITHPAGTTEYQNKLEEIADFYRLSSTNTNNVTSNKTKSESQALKLVENAPEEVDEDMAAMMEALETPESADVAAAPIESNVENTSEQIPATTTESIKRTIPEKENLSYGNMLLSDINMEMVLVFSKQPFTIGQSVVIEFLIPKTFIMSAEVDYCQSIVSRSKVISEKKPEFRIRLLFKHAYPGERTNLRNFLKSVEPSIPNETISPAIKGDDGSNDAPDDIESSLAGLGL